MQPPARMLVSIAAAAMWTWSGLSVAHADEPPAAEEPVAEPPADDPPAAEPRSPVAAAAPSVPSPAHVVSPTSSPPASAAEVSTSADTATDAEAGNATTASQPSLDERAWPEAVPRFRWWEYAGSAALMGGSLVLRFTVDVSGEPTWRGGILQDEATFDAFFIDSPQSFRDWRAIGDIGYFSSFAWSLVDPLIAGIAYDWETGAQMALMNIEAFAVYSMILSVSQIVVRRERPATRICDEDPSLARDLGVSCRQGGSNQNVNRSFIGGHVGTVTTAATLTCIHHAKLSLWGSPQADALPCVTWTAMTALVFASRTRTGQHYFTDNLLGVTVGGLSALVPYGLHYALADDGAVATPQGTLVTPTSLAVAPRTGGLTLQLSGIVQ